MSTESNHVRLTTAVEDTEPKRRRDEDQWHPLELLPYFRRWPFSWQRDILYTFIWNTGIFLFFLCISLVVTGGHISGRNLWTNLFLTQIIGYTIHGLFDLSSRLLKRWLKTAGGWQRALYFMLIPTLGVFLGYAIGFSILDFPKARDYVFSAEGARYVALFALGISGVLFSLFVIRDRQAQAEAALANETQRALDAERRALEAQLRMLQAQIEPHFLYNTLANAVGLIGPAPDKARLLLERLIDYLRASLAASREDQTTLGQEMETLRAYLDLMTVRMGERLQYKVECDPTLAALPLPPMLLQPVVENAIKHGLEPKIEGGEIRVEAVRQGTELQLTVRDTGQGFVPGAKPRPGGGVGLSNLRERLKTLYGQAGALIIADNQPCGVRVTLRLPLSP